MFPSYLQPDSMDCGPACLRIISKFYGKNYSMAHAARSLLHVTRGSIAA